MVGWVNGAGRAGPAPAPEGGARLRAGPEEGASGTKPGGTGGGRSENIWAETGAENSNIAASASCEKSLPLRPHPLPPFAHQIMAMLFTENAANSSLCKSHVSCFRWNRRENPMLSLRSRSSHIPCLGRLRRT